jgi:tetratricopeptide (TPR) repeat protein
MRFYLSSPLATVLFLLTLHSPATLPAFGRPSVAQPTILIASIESKIDEFITEGNRSLARGNPDNLGKNQRLGSGDFLLLDNESAIENFEKALRLDPKNRDALYGKGLAILQKYLLRGTDLFKFPSGSGTNDNLRDAIDYLSQATRMPSGKNFAPAYLELGRALLLSENYEDTIVVSRKALAITEGVTIKSKAWRAHSNIAIAHYQLMRQNPRNGEQYFATAEREWLQSTRLNPNNWLAYKWLAEMHRYAHQEFGYSQASLQQATIYEQKEKLAAQRVADLYEQSPEGQQERAEKQQNQRRQEEEAIRQRQAQARIDAWNNRTCTPIEGGGGVMNTSALLRNTICKEGYLSPNSPKGRNEPIPEGWQP